MSAISPVSTAVIPHVSPPAAAKGGKPDGDGDHGVEPTATAQAQPTGGNAGAGGAVNLIA